jgi:5'-nucleotidase
VDPALILITNDDGFGAEGLRVLEESLASLGEVWVVAPDREQSGQGHALTLNQPLRWAIAERHSWSGRRPTASTWRSIRF